MSFPCIICHFIFKGKHLWNIHGSSLDEDRHLLCSSCLIKYSEKNAKCPLRCNNKFNPVKLNPGYEQLITSLHYKYIKEHPGHQSIPDEDTIKNRKLWNKLIKNVDEYINLDYYPVIYGIGIFRNLTLFMRTLKSKHFEDNLEEILNINNEEQLSDILHVKVGVKRKYMEEQIEQELHELTPPLEIDLRQWLYTQRHDLN